MKILVPESEGFIGLYVTKMLLTKVHPVIGLDNINDCYDINLKYSRLKELVIKRENAKKYRPPRLE